MHNLWIFVLLALSPCNQIEETCPLNGTTSIRIRPWTTKNKQVGFRTSSLTNFSFLLLNLLFGASSSIRHHTRNGGNQHIGHWSDKIQMNSAKTMPGNFPSLFAYSRVGAESSEEWNRRRERCKEKKLWQRVVQHCWIKWIGLAERKKVSTAEIIFRL